MNGVRFSELSGSGDAAKCGGLSRSCVPLMLGTLLTVSVYLFRPPLALAQLNQQQCDGGLTDQKTAGPHPGPAESQQQTPPVQRVPDARDRIFFSNETESFSPLVTKLVRNTILDQKEIWASPFHMRRQDAKWAWHNPHKIPVRNETVKL